MVFGKVKEDMNIVKTMKYYGPGMAKTKKNVTIASGEPL